MKKAIPLIILGFLAFVALAQAFFTVHETQTALVLQLGKPVGEPRGPGLHFKLPFVQNVIYFDKRILDYDAPPAEVITEDKKTLVMDNYSKWRIVNPLAFYRTVRTIAGAQARLDDIIYSQLRAALGNYTLSDIVSQDRTEIMAKVTSRSKELIDEFGIEVVDVRIKRTDLPQENERAIFGRMRTERERQAKQYRSEGREESAKVRSRAEREVAVLLAEAERKAQILRGEGDAEATRIFAESLSKDPEFYAFNRSMDAYVASFQGETQFILTPSNRFLRYLQ